jgi:hypothetical protein
LCGKTRLLVCDRDHQERRKFAHVDPARALLEWPRVVPTLAMMGVNRAKLYVTVTVITVAWGGNTWLLGSERVHRFDGRGATRGQIAG